MRYSKLINPGRLTGGLPVHVVACLCLSIMLTWALLSPDPHATLKSAGIRATSSIDDFFQHLLAFGLLTVCCASCALRARFPLSYVAAGTMTFAASTEVLQGIVPGRTSDIVDLCGNFIGIIAAILATHAVGRWLPDNPINQQCASAASED